MSQDKHCVLKSMQDEKFSILLKDKFEMKLGRCPETDIKDKRCSRNQVSLLPDYDSETVTVTHLGGNPSSANGIILRKDSHTLKHNEVLEFLVGKHQFKLEFSPSSNQAEKRKDEAAQHSQENGYPGTKRFCKTEANKDVTCSKNMWEKIDDGKLYIFTTSGLKSSAKIAAYDMDGTIILTKSGRVFPKDKDDWMLANGSVKPKLAKLAGDGYKIVILTNQAGIGRGKTDINDFKCKIESIITALNVPVQAFIATTNSKYRKPIPGMWTYLETMKNDGIKIDMAQSFYVGDAAGRIVNWSPGKKKDFSSADRLLALNLKLRFCTPEEHFLNERPGKYELPLFNPAALDENAPLGDGNIVSKSKEVVVLVGFPGSGKSHFARKHLVSAGYTHVNRDTLGSWQKCVASMQAALAAGKSVVIDNTNPDRESRQRYLQAASAPCRCFLMASSIDHARHNVKFRELTDSKHVPVNDMIIHSYKSKFEPPSLDEGFTQIVNINFVPSFSDPEKKKLYQMYLLEK